MQESTDLFAGLTTKKAIEALAKIGVLVLLLDNILKPIIFGRKAAVPMLVVFIGAIGGFLASGILGFFLGAIVLTIGYKLFQVWLIEEEA